MRIVVLLIEDDPLIAQDLKEILEANDMGVLPVAHSADEATKTFHKHDPDVLLIDIMLKGTKTGIDFVNELGGLRKPFIFLTANSDHKTVEKAISSKPAAFITKPFDERELVITIELAFRNHIEQVMNTQSTNGSDHVFLKAGSKYEKVLLEKILYLEADGSYSQVVTKEKSYIISANLNHLSHQIREGAFYRIHRSFIVNMNCITGMDNDFLYIDEKAIPISRSRKNQIKLLLNKFS